LGGVWGGGGWCGGGGAQHEGAVTTKRRSHKDRGQKKNLASPQPTKNVNEKRETPPKIRTKHTRTRNRKKKRKWVCGTDWKNYLNVVHLRTRKGPFRKKTPCPNRNKRREGGAKAQEKPAPKIEAKRKNGRNFKRDNHEGKKAQRKTFKVKEGKINP